MANKQQKKFSKIKMASCNGGASTTVTPINHGANAFLKPCEAVRYKKDKNVKTWKVSRKHPAMTSRSPKNAKV
jgi:hypothetical protein